MDLLKDIQSNVMAKCFDKSIFSAVFEQLNQHFNEVTVWEMLPDLTSEVINTLEDLSKSNGFDELWSQFEPKLDEQLENWEKCIEQDDPSLVAEYVQIILFPKSAVIFIDFSIIRNLAVMPQMELLLSK